jgi:1-acyl-sn-glycerol-3-phosphate acyltransferase
MLILKPVIHTLYGLYFWAVTLMGTLTTLVLVAVLPNQTIRRKAARKAAGSLFFLTGSWPNVNGLAHLPEQASMVVANHSSYLDGILLIAVLPHHYQFVVKKEVSRLPLVHFMLRRLGVHFVDRFNPHKGAVDTRKILNAASQGGSLVFFPEGTFRLEPGLGRFHKGAFTIASRNSMPVVPIVIHGTRKMLPAKRLLPHPARLSITITPALNNGAPVTDARAALEQSRQQILQNLDETE